MPELPEVEAARRAVEEHCLNKKIVKAIIADDPKVVEGVSPSEFEASLVGKKIVGARRKGKNMWFELDSPPFPSFQFGMAGAIYIKGVAVTKYKRSAVNDTDEWPSKYSKFFVELDDGLELSFTDKRRFARVRLLKDPTAVPPVSELGPDALLEPLTVDKFRESLSKKNTAIKALLLDQSYISGIGNWIADEVLYQARIHPQQNASSLSKESCAALHKCIKEVIDTAVEVGADSNQFPRNWIFHSREKKPGKAFVDGKKIEFITAGGRTSAYVPELQKLTGGQAAKAEGNATKRTAKRKQSSKDKDGDELAGEEEDIAQNANSKKGLKSRGLHKNSKAEGEAKGSEDKGDDCDDNNGGANDETAASISKKTLKPRGRGKRPSKEAKSKGTDRSDTDDNDDDANTDSDEAKFKSKKGLTRGQARKPPAKRKSDDRGDDGGEAYDDAEDGSEDDSAKKTTGKVTNNKKGKAGMSSNKTRTSQNTRRTRKNAK